MAHSFDLIHFKGGFDWAYSLTDDPSEDGVQYMRSVAVSLAAFGQMMIATEEEDRARKNPVFTTEYFVSHVSRDFPPCDTEEEAWAQANRLVNDGHYQPVELVVKVREVAKYVPEVSATCDDWREDLT